jgi:hypothetical protein
MSDAGNAVYILYIYIYQMQMINTHARPTKAVAIHDLAQPNASSIHVLETGQERGPAADSSPKLDYSYPS